MNRKKQKPPYTGSLILEMPDRTQKTVKLPSVTEYPHGARETVTFSWKGRHQVTVKLVRVEGGWDLLEG